MALGEARRSDEVIDDILQELETVMPPILLRSHPKFQEWMGITPRAMSNLDCKGRGPSERVLCGKTAGYPRRAAIDWVRGRIRPQKVRP